MSLSLKIDNQFIALPDSTEISIEASNPIFSDAGAKTYLFEIPVESLRYIIGNADEIYGGSLYDVLEGKRAEIYIDGVQFFSGVVNLEDEISIEDGKIAVSIASGNLEFAQMIEGMNCRDVELKDDIEWGWRYDSISVDIRTNPIIENAYKDVNNFPTYRGHFTLNFPNNYIVVTNPNVSAAYSNSDKFCTIRRAYAITNKSDVDAYIDLYENGYNHISTKSGSYMDVLSLEYNSNNSSPCFYLLYFIECLEAKLGIKIDKEQISNITDVKRIAFVNTKLKVKNVGEKQDTNNISDIAQYLTGAEFGGNMGKKFGDYPFFIHENLFYTRQKVAVTSDNFPDEEVSKVLDSFLKIINGKLVQSNNSYSIVLVSDILKGNDVVVVNADVYSAEKIHNRKIGFRLSYNSGDDDDNFSFDYSQFDDIRPIDAYAKALWNVRLNNKTIYCDTRNGNTYAIKVSEEAEKGDGDEPFNPALFEVGGFLPAEYGDCSNDSLIEEVQLEFLPIINNDINGKHNKSILAWTPESQATDYRIENIYALAIEEEIENPKWVQQEESYSVKWLPPTSGGPGAPTIPTWSFNIWLKYFDYMGVTGNTEEAAINSYDPGFMLGIMRGPGSDDEPETFAQDFDGEGNYRVAFTAANYAFTSDSIDHCNRDFDYNGTGDDVGPDDLKGRFSLKLRAGKYDKEGNLIPALQDADGNSILDADRENRGLYDTFWKEYAYFTVNKKIVHLTCGMEIADIVNLDWAKRYRIGEWTGFIANYSFNVNKDGMGDVELDMYYL